MTAERACYEVGSPSNRDEVPEACSERACAVASAEAYLAICPVSGTIGLKVDLITLKALLKSDGLRRLDGNAYRFCPSPDCEVIYFDNAAGSIFRKADLTVRVGQKEGEDPIPICYCFGFTVADVRSDLAMLGKTEIPAFITREVKAGHCACEVRNPQGGCCPGNVTKVVKKVQLGRWPSCPYRESNRAGPRTKETPRHT